MPNFDFVVESKVTKTFRVSQVAGLYDVPFKEKISHRFAGSLPIEERDWNIGLIVGKSGSGKSSIARAVFGDQLYCQDAKWGPNAIVDYFPKALDIKQIFALLTSVGFSSPPDWAKPFAVLSNGQKFRVELARVLAERDFVVFDEFTSVVDRQVAKVGSEAVGNAIRKAKKKFVALSCHYDIEEWLKPDWVFKTDTSEFHWGSLRRGPIELTIRQVHSTAWGLFKQHHYLSADLNISAQCCVAFFGDEPIGFFAVLPLTGFKNVRRAHRLVILPDYQGIGIGNRLVECVADYWLDRGCRFRRTASHPAVTAHCKRSSKWQIVSSGSGNSPHGGNISGTRRASSGRMVCTFEYLGS